MKGNRTRIHRFRGVAWAAAGLLLLTLGTSSAQAKNFLLKTPLPFPRNLPGLGTTMVRYHDQMNAIPAVGLKMRIYDPGKLVPPFEILDAVSTGKTNAGFATAGYWAGKIPAAPLFAAVPFGPEAGEYLAWFLYDDGLKLYQEMYDQAGFNVKVLLCGMIAPETSGWFKKPINSPEDLKGLKMRFFGLGGDVMQKLGVSTSLLPGGEIFPALEKGAIDATEFSMAAIDRKLGFYKIAKFNYFPGWHQQSTSLELLVNKDVWNEMSDQQRLFMEINCNSTITSSFAEGEAVQAAAIEQNAKDGVQSIYWSNTMLAAFKGAWEDVAREQSAKDPFFKKVYDDLQDFHKGYKVWQELGYLPRATKSN